MQRFNGVILSRYKYQDDLLLNFLTTSGIKKIVARGAVKQKAKLRGVIELFDLTRLELIKGRSRYILIGGKLIKRPLYLRVSLEKSLFLMSLSEATQIIIRDENTKQILNFWIRILKDLKNLKEKYLMSFFAFSLAHLLYMEGLIDKELGRYEVSKLKNKNQFLVDLVNLPFAELIKNNYSKEEYQKFIRQINQLLINEGANFLTFDLFLEKIDKL